MVEAVRKLLIVLAVLWTATGNAVAFPGTPTCGDMPGGHSHHHAMAHDGSGHRGSPHPGTTHGDGGGAACQACCLGACAGTLLAPVFVAAGENPATIAAISYWSPVRRLTGRPTPPDAAPPRPSV